MAQHAQNVDIDQFINDAADAIMSGRGIDSMARIQAAGHAAQRAAENDDTDLLDLLILVAARRYNAAFHKQVDMSVQDGTQAAPAPGPFDSLINPPGNNGPAPTAQASPPPAAQAATNGGPAPARGRNK